MMLGDIHFLSKTNPIATVDQRDVEALTMRIAQSPVVQKAKAQAAQRWKVLVGRDVSAEAWSHFDDLMQEYVFSYTLKAVNSDANYPKVVGHLYGPPHEWFGMKVPGSRTGGGSDNPDNNYTFVPIDGQARFEIHGQRFDPAPSDVPIQLTSNIAFSTTLGNLQWDEVQFNADGSFVITLDPLSASGRSNHIQTTLDTRYLFMRDCRSDWRQVPCAYRVNRLDPPTAPPLTEAQMAARAALFIVDDVAPIHYWMRIAEGFEVNTIPAPFKSISVGGLATQVSVFARLNIADDEAYVITASSGGAVYRGLALHDYWFRSLDYGDRTTCLSNSQTAHNADDSITYVVSLRDPCVHNWLDTRGFHEVRIMYRWQLPHHPTTTEEPSITGQLVKLSKLEKYLPQGMKKVTAAERQQQLVARLEMFKLRYVDY
jgi:hypothetical protein